MVVIVVLAWGNIQTRVASHEEVLKKYCSISEENSKVSQANQLTISMIIQTLNEIKFDIRDINNKLKK